MHFMPCTGEGGGGLAGGGADAAHSDAGPLVGEEGDAHGIIIGRGAGRPIFIWPGRDRWILVALKMTFRQSRPKDMPTPAREQPRKINCCGRARAWHPDSATTRGQRNAVYDRTGTTRSSALGWGLG